MMTTWSRLFLAFVGLACALVPGLVGAQAPPGIVAVRAARLIDGTGAPPLADPVVLIRGDRIEAVGRGLAVPPGATVIDLGDATLLPGLIDLHTHLVSRSGEGITWEDE